ncbi:MAG: ATPase [Marinilabiliaceae bacterium]|nr:ATPase [Marinilabiliaceae bacterium]
MKKSASKYTSLFFSILTILAMLFDIGFNQNERLISLINYTYFISLIGIIVGLPLKYVFGFKNYLKLKIWIVDLVIWLFFNYLLLTMPFLHFSEKNQQLSIDYKMLLAIAFAINFIREISSFRIRWKYKRTNPAAIFVISFALLIITGSLLLMLPNATHYGIGFTDALFTSTSAVCVTGLVVVDTGTFFTPIGQSIIMVLIQLGGIGIMTFTSFFAYFFLGGASYQNLIILGNLTSENKISKVIGTLKKIMFFTFLVEAIGALLIYWNIKITSMSEINSVFFAVFHSISAFCNAGFSTLSSSFYDTVFRFNYSLHFVIAILFIIGGLGFPVIINLYSWVKHFIINRFLRLNKQREVLYKAHIISLNTKLVIYTTLFLLIIGTLFFLLLENNNTLAEHYGIGKIITAFFSAATPRTAGFNTVDMSIITLPTLILIVFLMWVGASPASTGGGIKTSTFTLALFNAFSLAKGKKRMEINKREIPEISLKRSFAFVFLSLFIIGFMTFLLLVFEPEKIATDLLFEVVSALSTVGLSRGITGNLSDVGKILIVLTMFIGRIGALTFLTSMVKQTKEKLYQYPSESILIN